MVGGTFFIVGIALVMVGTVFFVVNIYKTIAYTPEGWAKQPAGALLASALGITAVTNFFARKKTEHLVPLPVAAIARGTVDTALNSAVILVHRRADPRLHGRGAVGRPRGARPSTRCSTRTGSGGGSTSSPTGSC